MIASASSAAVPNPYFSGRAASSRLSLFSMDFSRLATFARAAFS